MGIAINREVKELIRKLQELHKKGDKLATLYELESIYNVSRQTLKNWAERPNKEYERLCKFVERARKDLGLKESTAYRMAIKSGIKED